MNVRHTITAWADTVCSLVYPEVCQICGSQPASHARFYVCERCRSEVKRIEPPFCARCGLPYAGDITTDFECDHCADLDLKFCWGRSAARADGPVLEAIHKYKYNRKLWFEGFLAELLVEAATSSLQSEPWDALVPVPLFPVKQREREFNQAEELARRLGRATGIPVETRAIRRVLPTPSQTHLGREERAANMHRAFALHSHAECKGKRFVLVDDVFTTGATTNACAAILLRAGAEIVGVWTVARRVYR
jgi:competence protein ComFC